MNNQKIINEMNTFLHEASIRLTAWLEGLLPRVSNSWWDDCVITSLSFSQRELAERRGFTKLSDFDLAALLRIANKSWYDMRTVAYLPSAEREVVRSMIGVRNNWAHIGAELPGKDIMISDLHIISYFIRQIKDDNEIQKAISDFIEYIENPDNISTVEQEASPLSTEAASIDTTPVNGEIHENSLVYLVASPEVCGIVVSITDLGDIKKYNVFVDNSTRVYYSGQIALVEKARGYQWIDLDTFRSCLAAYQISNPSSQNLYSLNSARIDFVPYQFRPALKMIHADEPRILIADSVGVGKTIEAGLIIKELEARNELERIAVICPRPLVSERKWEQEMKRFDEEFVPVDGATLRQIISDTDRDGEWPIRYNKIIVPYSIMDSRAFYGDDQNRGRSFGLTELDPEPHFDLVIVDEAHHIRNGSMDRDKAFAYKCTKYFCDHSDAVVMLTATPLQTGDDDLFTLLNVLRPDVVIDQKTFAMMSRPNEYISRAVRFVRAAEDNWEENVMRELHEVRRTQWGGNVIAENPLYDDIMARLEQKEFCRESRVKLISDIEALHSFNTMINRTRRRDIQDFCIRRTHTISTQFTEYQQELHDELLSFERSALSVLHNSRSVAFMMSTIRRQAASCIFGLAPYIRDIINRRIQQMNDDADSEWDVYDVDAAPTDAISALAKKVLALADGLPKTDPKFEKTLQIILQKGTMQNNKIMVFSTFRHTLAYLRGKLSSEGFRVAQVDGSVKDDVRFELKTRFELSKDNPDAIDILLFTEVGSEGLDYQFCDMMINYDLPWNPMRIEQRIGRIDRRGQLSEAVNIYNIITENTIDADIYYRCLMRIGIFESHVGDCEDILGTVASEIEGIILDAKLTAQERQEKLEQIADNEVRKAQELTRLEEEEKELFGFDLTEFTTSQEIRRAENLWLTQSGLQRLVEHYFNARLGNGAFILGEAPLKTLRLSASARGIIRDDLRNLSGSRNMLRRKWEAYLSGRNPIHSITFDSDAASKDRDSFFITALHPLAKQAAEFFSENNTAHLRLEFFSNAIPSGIYLFSVYAWKYVGFNTYTKIVTVCENETIANNLPDIVDAAYNSNFEPNTGLDWTILEEKQVELWRNERSLHKRETEATVNFKIESISNNQRNKIRTLEQQISDATDEAIRRMRTSELETVKENYLRKLSEINGMTARADIYASLLVNGFIIVKEG